VRLTTRALAAVGAALLLQFPTGIGYYPVWRALWDMSFGDIGHGTRAGWLSLAIGVASLYTFGIFLGLTVLDLVMKRWRRPSK
jgi:hypothetical protein